MFGSMCTALVMQGSTQKGALLANSSTITETGYITEDDWNFYETKALRSEVQANNVLFLLWDGVSVKFNMIDSMREYLHSNYRISQAKCRAVFANYIKRALKFNYYDILIASHSRNIHAASITKAKKGIAGYQYITYVWGEYLDEFRSYMLGFDCATLKKALYCNSNIMVLFLNEEMLTRLCCTEIGHSLLPYFNNCNFPTLDAGYAQHGLQKFESVMGEDIVNLMDKYGISSETLLKCANKIMPSKWCWEELRNMLPLLEEEVVSAITTLEGVL